ncbi:MAG TPA: T9SS type A sorting domain-containing protein [Ignavibacteriaceae bacterium]|nr:T9SS type A sorting domain-containing protein [Ignavibacteriaceae bacterium]
MNKSITYFLYFFLLSGIIFSQVKSIKDSKRVITPDGKIMSFVDGKALTEDLTKEITKPINPNNDAPIGTPFSWDNNLSFTSTTFNSINAIVVSGSDVFIGGDFTNGMGIGADYFIRWNQKNNTWHTAGIGNELNAPVHSIAVSGNDVYIGGEFTDAGGNSNSDYIVRWDGSNWNSLGSGTGLNGAVYAIAVSGSNVFVGGDFIGAGGLFESDHIAKWNGSNWIAIGQLYGTVYAIEIFSSLVHIGGAFTSGSGNSPYFVVYDDLNAQWYGLGSALNGAVYAMDIDNTNLYIGGEFTNAGGNPDADVVARYNLYNSTEWEAIGTSILTYDYYPNRAVKSLAVFGDDLYVGGEFWSPYNSYFNGVAYWNGTTWNSLYTGLFGECKALAISGTDLLAGGVFGFRRWFGGYAEGLFAGVQSTAVSGSGLVQFNTPNDSTRISLNLIEIGKGNGLFNVFCYENKPAGGGILPVSNHRWIIQNKGFLPTFSYDDIIRIKFSDFIDSSGIINPYVVQVYYRPTPGRGQFTALYTEYDFSTNEIWAYLNSYGEFAIGIPNTVDGVISSLEYGSHFEGQNMQTSDGKTWYMRTDDYYMYFGISNYSDSSDAVNIYMDNSSIAPVNYHFNPYGTETGVEKDGLTPNLPFGAEYFAYIKPSYDEYKHSNQSGGWLDIAANSLIKSFNGAGNVLEFVIPLSSLPVSMNIYNYPLQFFNWLGFLSKNGNVSSRVPNNANPSGISEDLCWYYPSSLNNLTFAQSSFTHIGSSLPNFGSINCYNFTFFPTNSATTINRSSGEWNIDGELVVYDGTLTFSNPDSVKLSRLLHMNGNINFPSNVPLKVGASIYQTNIYGANLNFSSGHSTVIDVPFGTGSIYISAPFQNLTTRFGNIGLISDITINESLTLQSGIINTVTFDTFYVKINQSAIVTRTGSGYVNGYLVRWANNGIVDFPVGSANGYSPVSFNFSNVINPNRITVAAFQNVHPNIVTPAQSIQRYWNITKDSTLTFTNTSINFQYLPTDFNTEFFEATDEATMVVGKYDSGNWTFPTILSRSTGGNNDGGSIIISGITSFSDFTLAKNESALPVELTAFTAYVKDKCVNLKWFTSTEVNNYGFEIERSISSNGERNPNWQKIGFVSGSGNSNSEKSYSFTDAYPSGGSKFSYRLKQIDNDGSYEYSNVIEVELIPAIFELTQNYPNPFNPTTTISFSIPKEEFISLKVFNSLGEEVADLINDTKPAGNYSLEFSGSSLSSGIYFYKLQSGSYNQTKKMILLK